MSKYKIIWALYHYLALGDWDVETYLPEKGIMARSEASAKIRSLSQRLFLDPEFKAHIQKAQAEKNLNPYEKGMVRVLMRQLDYYEKLPSRFIEEFTRATSQAQMVWRRAKKHNDFSLFQPHLEKIVQLSQKQSEYLGYKDHPYDPLLDLYEEGWTTQDVNVFFDSFRKPLKTIFQRVQEKPGYKATHPLEQLEYDKRKLKKIHHAVLDYLQASNKGIRLDESTHPFTQSMALSDVRITTTYHPHDFRQSVMSVIHEFGHALYDLQCDDRLEYSPIAGGLSLGIHESQSRFWENMVGRSKPFLEIFAKDFSTLSPSIEKYFKGKDVVEELFKYFNLVRPSLIRTEADEISYHFHIMLRFEIEKGLLEGTIKTKELPGVWKQKMKEYLGDTPKSDAQGVLQDIHWSMGSIGYFPTYSIGTFLSAIWKDEMEKELGGLDALIKRETGIRKMQQWLKKNVHQFGSTYTLKELLHKNGRKLDTKPMLKYLKDKF